MFSCFNIAIAKAPNIADFKEWPRLIYACSVHGWNYRPAAVFCCWIIGLLSFCFTQSPGKPGKKWYLVNRCVKVIRHRNWYRSKLRKPVCDFLLVFHCRLCVYFPSFPRCNDIGQKSQTVYYYTSPVSKRYRLGVRASPRNFAPIYTCAKTKIICLPYRLFKKFTIGPIIVVPLPLGSQDTHVWHGRLERRIIL